MGGGWREVGGGVFVALCTVGRANRLYKPLRQNCIDVSGFFSAAVQLDACGEKIQARRPVDAARELLPEPLFCIIFGLMGLFYLAALMLFTGEHQAGRIPVVYCRSLRLGPEKGSTSVAN